MKTTTIRVTAETRDRLNALARARGAPASEVVAALVQEADDRALLEAASEAWARLAADPDARTAYEREARELDAFGATPPAY